MFPGLAHGDVNDSRGESGNARILACRGLRQAGLDQSRGAARDACAAGILGEIGIFVILLFHNFANGLCIIQI